jgi:hypothetical protein
MITASQGGFQLHRLVLTAIFSIIGMASALADVRILSSSGGEVGEYLELFSVLRQSGERIVIDGPCYSACTLVLSIVPNDRICVTPKAVLGFHAAQVADRYGRRFPAPDATRVVAATYPAGIRAWIGRHGGLTSKVIRLRGRELAALYPRCS